MVIYNNIPEDERVLLVGVDLQKKSQISIESSMKELEELVKAAGGIPISSIVQKRNKIDSSYFIGKGKVEEIRLYCDELDIDTVVFNDELSGMQIRNIENIVERKIIDRTTLILDIFANRATTKEGKLQVELAQLKYRLPRLIGLGKSLSRTGAGIGTRGPGEKKLEIDRRHILRRISEIERQLQEVKKVREVKRKRRDKSSLPIVALIGYTNAGKSTLLNTILNICGEDFENKEVFAYDMLFATLETTLRKAKLPNGHDFLITDTVGFVSKLPTHLIEAFKGTLEEIKYADLLLHVVDCTNKDLDIQIKTTLDVIKDLKVSDKSIITVFNKVDKIKEEDLIYNISGPKLFISAKEGKNIDKLSEISHQISSKKFVFTKILFFNIYLNNWEACRPIGLKNSYTSPYPKKF
ncbi:GTP-binding protein HflX [Caloranaerobacter azorensis DSM 13643]|uniref:GTPase HflX n=1 Tax=Caloranaerobacter azorensis DSM 13643 TaxID=1121264 RepID=A0A1M5WJ85_9FIRM|nr:GTPase HflX [Caloranaerobacter azorensis]SHH87487.1 GTP-binding protein HflX [Caloranaerobacter azorensis DSM 13643]